MAVLQLTDDQVNRLVISVLTERAAWKLGATDAVDGGRQDAPAHYPEIALANIDELDELVLLLRNAQNP